MQFIYKNFLQHSKKTGGVETPLIPGKPEVLAKIMITSALKIDQNQFLRFY